MDFEKILRLIEAVSASELTGFSLEENGMRLSLEKRPGAAETIPETVSVLRTVPVLQAPSPVAPAGAAAGTPVMQMTGTAPVMQGVGFPAEGTSTLAAVPGATAASSASGVADMAPVEGALASGKGNSSEEEIVKAPLVGTFYAAPSEDAEPFVKAGDTVKKGQVLGIIEAMKLMNEIESEYDGVMEAVLISNEQVVEYGQPLFRIRRKG
ncbi:MAG: acetyl-CoA carboxylase biotin carboxyl carrier protein [Lachnospiraceae bacterium]|nr:acetyl-CoA carboxylase biotin carboxyl carrier protein [Lachnospiraceae bacterium]